MCRGHGFGEPPTLTVRNTELSRPNSYRAGPDEDGHFGIFGGRFVAETLMPLILEVERAYERAKDDPFFKAELKHYLTHYVAGRARCISPSG